MHSLLLPGLFLSPLFVGASPVASQLQRRVVDKDVCNNEQLLNAQTWTDGKYQGALENYLDQGPAPNFPWRDNKNAKPDKSTIDVLLSYAANVKDYRCDPTQDETGCDARGLRSAENCGPAKNGVNQPAAIIVLEALSNYGTFMHNLAETAAGLQTSFQAKSKNIMDTFNPLPPAPSKTGLDKASGIIGMLAGLAGLLGPLGAEIGAITKTSIGAVAGTMAAGAGAAGGIVSGTSAINNNFAAQSNLNPDSERYQDYNAAIAGIADGIHKSITGLANQSINSIPDVGNGNIRDWARNSPLSLVNILASGAFADVHSANVKAKDTEDVENLMANYLINELYKQQGVFIVRTNGGGGGISRLGKGNPPTLCVDATNDIPFPKTLKWCDNEGNMYMLMKNSISNTTVPGIAGLAEYNIDIPSITRGSWDWQISHGGMGKAPAQADFDAKLKGINWDKLDYKDLQTWNLPVCDLDAIPPPNAPFVFENNGPDGCTNDSAECEFKRNVFCRCRSVKVFTDTVPVPDPTEITPTRMCATSKGITYDPSVWG